MLGTAAPAPVALAFALGLAVIFGLPEGAAPSGDPPGAEPAEPDFRFYERSSASARSDLEATRATVAKQLEQAKQFGADEADLARLSAIGDAIQGSLAVLAKIEAFVVERRDLDDWRQRLGQRTRELAELEEKLAADQAERAPAVTEADRARAEEEIATVEKTREQLKARIRAVPKLEDEKRAERDRAAAALDELDPEELARLTRGGATREKLRIEIAFLDGSLAYLHERQAILQQRLSVLSQEKDYWGARLAFVESVLSGRHGQRVGVYARLAEVERQLGDAARDLHGLVTDSPEHRLLLERMKQLSAQKAELTGELRKIEARERSAAAAKGTQALLRRLEDVRRRLAEAAASGNERLEREEVLLLLEEARADADRIEARVAKARAEVDALPKDAAPAAREAALEVLRAEEEQAATAMRIVAILSDRLARLEERRSLFERQDRDISAAAIGRAFERLAEDVPAILTGGRAVGRAAGRAPGWRLGGLVALTAAVAALGVLVRRAIDGYFARNP